MYRLPTIGPTQRSHYCIDISFFQLIAFEENCKSGSFFKVHYDCRLVDKVTSAYVTVFFSYLLD